MQGTGKPSVRKFVETLPNVNMKAKEQYETLDNLIRQTIISDSFVSFPEARENPVQWINWLDTPDQQNVRKGSRSSKLEVGLETLPNVDMKAKEQHETLDNLIRQAIISDSFVSFPEAKENPVQWIDWLDTLDQQNVRKGSRSSKLEVGLEIKDRRQEEILKSNMTKGEGLGTNMQVKHIN